MIKKLQNNYTTPEQSKRLLELGVPAESADCVMFPYDETFEQYELCIVPFNISTYEIYNEDGTICPGKTPCWSVGRLMEIYLNCCTFGYGLHFSTLADWDEDMIDSLVELYETAVKCKYMDFSKLEE